MLNNNKKPICPICGDETTFEFSVPCDYRKPSVHKDYEIFWCSVCDYGQIWDRPSMAEIANYYTIDDYYTHKDSNTTANEEVVSFLDRLRTHISWRLDAGDDLTPYDTRPFLEGKDLTICEIGCGNGGNLSKFRSNGFSVFGVEPDPAARREALKSINTIFDGTAEQLPETIANNKYDVVLMSHVLEHCLDINAAVSNAIAILKEGGIFVVETPNCQSLGFKTYRGEWPWSDIPRHLNFFTPSSLKLLLDNHGLKVATKKYRGFCRQFSNPWLNTEEQIWLAFSKHNAKLKVRTNFKNRAWKLLFRSIFSSKASKYDSVRFIAIK